MKRERWETGYELTIFSTECAELQKMHDLLKGSGHFSLSDGDASP